MTAKKIISFFIAGFMLLVNYSFKIQQQNEEQEYSLKAAFIYRFTDYVEWTDNPSDVFAIAVLGESEVTNPLTEIVKDKKIKNKRIVIRQFQNINDIPGGQAGLSSYQIIFVSHKYTPGIENVISRVADLPILVIGEESDAAEKGALINFKIKQNKLKFEVNMKAVAKAGLKISSQLLQHATIISTS